MQKYMAVLNVYMSIVIWQKATSLFCHLSQWRMHSSHVRWAGKFACGGRRTVWNALLHRDVTVRSTCPSSKVPFYMGSGILDPYLIMVYWAHVSQLPNGISIGSAIFALLTHVPAHGQTHRPWCCPDCQC